MEVRYCRHCQKAVPMFDDREYELLSDVHRQCLQVIKDYRQTHGVSLEETPLSQLYQPLFDLYLQLAHTSLVFEVDEVMRRHYLSRWKAYRDEVRTNQTIRVLLDFPDEGIKQSITVIELDTDTYRIEDIAASLLGFVEYGDVIKAGKAGEGHLVFKQKIEPTVWQTSSFLLSRKVMESSQMNRILEEIENQGGHSEIVMGGNLLIALPPDSQIGAGRNISDLVAKIEAGQSAG